MSSLNGLIIDEKTGAIRIGIGASGYFSAIINADAESIDTDKDIVLFIVSSKKTSGVRYTINGVDTSSSQERVVFSATFGVSVNEDGKYQCNISLANEDTRGIPVGEYIWNAVLITDPAYRDDGTPYADERTDAVIPFYTDGERPTFTVEEVGKIV